MKTKKGYEPINLCNRKVLVGNILKYLRQRENLSLGQLCQIIDINKQTYANYEAGRCEPRIETLIVLANYYDVTMDFITGMTLMKKGIIYMMHEFPSVLNNMSTDELIQNADRFTTLCQNMLLLSAYSKKILELAKDYPALQKWADDCYNKLFGISPQPEQQ